MNRREFIELGVGGSLFALWSMDKWQQQKDSAKLEEQLSLNTAEHMILLRLINETRGKLELPEINTGIAGE